MKAMCWYVIPGVFSAHFNFQSTTRQPVSPSRPSTHSPFSAIAFCSPLKGTQMKSLKEGVTLLYSSLEDCGELLSCQVPPSGGHNNTGVYSTKYTYYRFSILLTLVHISALSGILQNVPTVLF